MTDVAGIVAWSLEHWFQLAIIVGLFAIASGLMGVAHAIGEASLDLTQEMRDFAAAMCEEAPDHAWQDEGYRYSFIERLTGSLQSSQRRSPDG